MLKHVANSRDPLAPVQAAFARRGLDATIDAALQEAPHRLPPSASHAALPLDALDDAAWHSAALQLPAYCRRMRTPRLRSFLAGRLCAEQALAALGQRGAAVGRGAAGEPVWPAGCIGSIAHTAHHAYAAVASQASHAGLGIDSEPVITDDETLTAVRSFCCTRREQASLLSGADPALSASVLFSVKEAFYKAVHRHVARLVDFDEVDVAAIDPVGGHVTFAGAGDTALDLWVSRARARFVILDAVVHSTVILDA
jgi:enterobactin synthetase component D